MTSVLVALLRVTQIGPRDSGHGGGITSTLLIPNGMLIATLLAALLTVPFWPSSSAKHSRS
jgi:hypothetical protein